MKRLSSTRVAGLLVLCAATAHADVTASGDFQRSFPIDVPTLRGITPTVRLAYAASAPSGTAGVGWSLDASSVIARTGPRGGLPITSAAPDAFELDGEPLLPCVAGSTSPSCTTALVAFGSSSGYYTTRRESFARIQFDAAANAWNVTTTNGFVARYVTRDGGLRWLLDRREDRHGNATRYDYACTAGATCELTSIRYGDDAVIGAEVRFYYEARPDVARRANGAAILTAAKRLRTIRITVGGQLVRSYALAYQPGASRSVLTSVTQYASDANVDGDGQITPGPTPPLPATTFQAGGGSASVRVTPVTASGLFALGELPRNPSPPRFRDVALPNHAQVIGIIGDTLKRAPYQTLVGDFDGDARTDFINVHVSKKCAAVAVEGVMARKIGYATIGATTIASQSAGTSGCEPTSWVADIDGDHRDDLITKFRNTLYVSRLSNTSFKSDPTTTAWTISAENCASGDVDGDLRDDLVCLADRGAGPELVTARSRGDATFAVTGSSIGLSVKTPMAVGDINNDGLADVVLAPSNGSTRWLQTMVSYGYGYTAETQATPWVPHTDDRLAATDVDGDGLADVVLQRANTSLAAELAMATEGATNARYELRTLPTSRAQIADVDGDGVADVVNDELAYLGDGNGSFAAPVYAFPVATCSASHYTDTDGDGRTDRLCVYDGGDELLLDDYAPSVPVRDRHRWMDGDIDGDGRGDYVYTYAKNPGLGVITVLTSTQQRVAWQQLPTGAIPGLDDSSAAHWIVTDAGGPSGKPDGRDDLVMVDTDGAAPRVYTMLSNGDGTYAPHIQTSLALANPSDLGNYWPLDVDGDGATDLVHLAPSLSGVRLSLLRSRGDGTWTASQRYYFASANPRIVGATSFKPADVNGDGLLDLVHAYSGPGVTGTALRVLVNRGDGTFGEVASTVAITHADVSRWMTLDLNGDGATDLVHATSATSATGSGLIFESLLSRGDGRFVPGNLASAWLDASAQPELRRALEATAMLRPADLDGDRGADFWHVSQYRDASGARRMRFVELRSVNGGTAWQAVASTPAVPASPPWAWRPYRDAARLDGTGLALVDGNAGVAYLKDLPSDRIARIDNGTGGASAVDYMPLLGSRIYLPSGVIPVVVRSTTAYDFAYQSQLAHVTTYRYAGVAYSHARRAATFAWIEASDPRATMATTYAIDDACGGTPLVVATFDTPTKKALTYTQRTLAAPGYGPFVCLVQQEATYACDVGGTCSRDTLRDLVYDTFGNVASATEQARDAPTRTEYAPVWGNNAAYIVDKPLYRSVFQDTGTGPTLMRLDEYLYDGNVSAYQLPGTRGELRAIHHWDSAEQQFHESTIEYDAQGLVKRTVDAGGRWVDTTYDLNHHAFPERSCTALGCVSAVWDSRFGVQTHGTDLDNLTTVHTYDPHGRLSATVTPDGRSTTTRILAHGVVTGPVSQRQRSRVEIKDDSKGDGVLWSETLFDGTGRPYRTIAEGGATQVREYSDASTRPARVSLHFTTTSPLYTTYGYDALGRRTEVRAPDGSSRRWTFRAREVDELDELGRKRTFVIDGRGDVISSTETLMGAPVVTTYGYDGERRLIGTRDALGNTTSRYFDTLGRMLGESDPDRGLREYTYEPNGQLHASTDAKGQQIEYVYDASARLTRRAHLVLGAVVRTVTWTYDELPGQGPQGASHGRVVRVDDHQGATQLRRTYHYDAGGRVDRDEQCIDGTCLAMGRTFDIAGRLHDLTYPDAGGNPDEVVRHVYDDTGRLKEVGGYVLDASYAADGAVGAMRFGNGIITRWLRDPQRRWLDSIDVANVYRATFVHDLAGRIESLDERAPTGIVTHAYTYDDLGRLTDAVSSNPQLDRHYTYDAIGRIDTHSQLGTFQYADPAHVHAMTNTTGGAIRQYDANGNTTLLRDPSGRKLEITWTDDDRPARFATATGRYDMAYDATGIRVKKAGPTTSLYFGPHVALENGQLAKYYFAGELRIARRHAGSVSYYHHDAVRAVRATTDESGNVASRYQFDPYGAPIVRNQQNGDEIAFGSLPNDEELDLVYLNARYYDPIAGRFLSADSVVRDALAPQSLDRYAYVEGDPVNYIDPSGHMRRDVELMKERKEGWRALMVQYEAAMRDWCEPFCVPLKAPRIDMTAPTPLGRWGTTCPGLPPRGALAEQDPHAPPHEPEPAPDRAPEPGRGGGCGPDSPQGCLLELASGSGPLPESETFDVYLGGGETTTIEITVDRIAKTENPRARDRVPAPVKIEIDLLTLTDNDSMRDTEWEIYALMTKIRVTHASESVGNPHGTVVPSSHAPAHRESARRSKDHLLEE